MYPFPVFPDSGSVPGPPIQFEELTPDSVRAGYTFTDPNMIGEVDEYFYHGDHISSVNLVTDKKATIVQSFTYMPYGELLVEESSVDLAYRFSAKETDRETGLSYFGARYYDPTVAVWMGADPVFHAGSNAYAYCLGNPINLVDPNGMDEIYYDEDGTEIGRIKTDEDRRYVIRTTQTTEQMYTEISAENGKSNPISKQEAVRAKMIASMACNGSGIFYSKEDIPMQMFVEIPNQQQFDAGFNFIKDDGSGGTKPNNNIEYAWNIKPVYEGDYSYGNNKVIGYEVAKEIKSTEVGDPSKNSVVDIDPRRNHTHPSGTKGIYDWLQPPSKTDIANYNKDIIPHTVWGMRSKTIYFYDNNGVEATIPFSIYQK
ncbi:MAG: RHS repeat-associated core domain-containing protein [Paludibacteraceae bacterium]|nr:RHS repeat-associated core domain-containing protein [Paludibacteraceae bacterium]